MQKPIVITSIQTKIWGRGLPLKLINTQFNLEQFLSKKNCKVGIWQRRDILV